MAFGQSAVTPNHREPTTVSRPSLHPRRDMVRLWRRNHSTAEKLHTRAGPSPSKRPRGASSLAASKGIPRSDIPKNAHPNRSGEVRPVGQIGGATYSVSCRLKRVCLPRERGLDPIQVLFVAQCDVQAHLASKGGHSGGLLALSEESGATAAWNPDPGSRFLLCSGVGTNAPTSVALVSEERRATHLPVVERVRRLRHRICAAVT